MNTVSAQLLDAVTGLGAAGDTIQFALSPADVHIAEEIDTYLAGYVPQGFRADDAVPIVLVDKATDSYRNFSANNAFRLANVRTGRQAAVQEVDPETVLDTYLVEERALGSFVPRATQAQSRWDVMAGASRRIQWALALDREVRIFGTGGLLSTAANWDANNVITVGTFWSDPTADPIADLQAAMRASAQMVTKIFMGEPVSHAFMKSPAVRAHMLQHRGDNPSTSNEQKSTGSGAVLDYQLPGLPPIHVVPQKVLNEATGALDYIFDNQVVLTGDPGTPVDGQSIQTAVTFRERKDSGNGFLTRQFEVDGRGLEGGEMIVSGHAEDVKFTANNVGGLLEGILS